MTAHSRSEVRFLLNGVPCRVSAPDPHRSLLAWLREERGLCGTKEGCAEGDCGACMVLIGEPRAGRLELRPGNACIRLLPTLDGLAVFTVEALGRDGHRHPVQKAMVEAHASQCGFCTPGFVMTLTAHFKTQAQAPTHSEACQMLAGNLCRCTGYRPILAAAQRMVELPPDKAQDPIAAWLAQPGRTAEPMPGERLVLERLAALEDGSALAYSTAEGVRWSAPQQLTEFSRELADHPEAWIVAGATDVGLWINKALQRSSMLISSGRVPELDRIELTPQNFQIGAAVNLERAFAALDEDYPELTHLWQRFASWPIRSVGTLGGNLANGSPIGDSLPALMALGAEVILQRGEATRRLPLERLYLDYKRQAREPGEWLRAVQLPRREHGWWAGHILRLAAYKHSRRNEQDISAVCTVLALALDERGTILGARLAFGGMAGTARRAIRAEAALLGRRWCAETARLAGARLAEDFRPLDDHRASAEYRLAVARAHLERAWLETREEHEQAARVY